MLILKITLVLSGFLGLNVMCFNWVNIPFPFSKWYFKKYHGKQKDPIYKLEKTSYSIYSLKSDYSIVKYTLCYGKNNNNAWLFFIPLLGLFKYYGYYPTGKDYGDFTEKQIQEHPEILFSPYTNIKDYWEACYGIEIAKRDKQNMDRVILEQNLESINEEFIENYEKD